MRDICPENPDITTTNFGNLDTMDLCEKEKQSKMNQHEQNDVLLPSQEDRGELVRQARAGLGVQGRGQGDLPGPEQQGQLTLVDSGQKK